MLTQAIIRRTMLYIVILSEKFAPARWSKSAVEGSLSAQIRERQNAFLFPSREISDARTNNLGNFPWERATRPLTLPGRRHPERSRFLQARRGILRASPPRGKHTKGNTACSDVEERRFSAAYKGFGRSRGFSPSGELVQPMRRMKKDQHK